MQIDNLTYKRDLTSIRQKLSCLKKDLLKLRKVLYDQKQSEITFLKSREVKRILRISSSTLQVMRNNGQIPFTRLRGQLRYDFKDVKELLLADKNCRR
jgi:predicted site-specific integrase-resolvase